SHRVTPQFQGPTLLVRRLHKSPITQWLRSSCYAAGWRERRTNTVEEERRAQGGNGDQTVARVRDDGRDEAARDCKDGRKSRAREGDCPRVVQGTSTARRSQRWPGSRTSNGAHHRGQKEESADTVANIDARTQHRLHSSH